MSPNDPYFRAKKNRKGVFLKQEISKQKTQNYSSSSSSSSRSNGESRFVSQVLDVNAEDETLDKDIFGGILTPKLKRRCEITLTVLFTLFDKIQVLWLMCVQGKLINDSQLPKPAIEIDMRRLAASPLFGSSALPPSLFATQLEITAPQNSAWYSTKGGNNSTNQSSLTFSRSLEGLSLSFPKSLLSQISSKKKPRMLVSKLTVTPTASPSFPYSIVTPEYKLLENTIALFAKVLNEILSTRLFYLNAYFTSTCCETSLHQLVFKDDILSVTFNPSSFILSPSEIFPSHMGSLIVSFAASLGSIIANVFLSSGGDIFDNVVLLAHTLIYDCLQIERKRH
jgi:hypothetical protein